MKKDTMLDCFLTIKEIRSKVANMVLFNEKAHKHFFALVKIVENELINVEDNYDHDSAADLKVVSDITKLKFEVDQYMKTGRLNDDPELFFSEQDYLSGSELEKQHRMGIYKNLALVLQEMEEIDIEKLKKIRERWLIEKDNYSEIEKEKVEEVLAEAFLVYQTKFIISEKEFPQTKIQEFCNIEAYEQVLKSKLADEITKLPKDSFERLDLENVFLNWNFKQALANPEVWSMLTKTNLDIDIDLETVLEDVKIQEETTSTEETPEQKDSKQDSKEELEELEPLDTKAFQADEPSVLIVYLKKKPDGTHVFKQKVKLLDEKGRFNVLFNKDQIVELYFLEGTKQLGYTKNGTSRPSYVHLSEFPNLRNVYLPQSLETIEQGYFTGCTKLQHVYLPEGISYRPHDYLFPKQAEVVPKKTDKKVPMKEIVEPDEKAVVFLQRVINSTGEPLTEAIKVRLSSSGDIPKSFKERNDAYITQALYTFGTITVTCIHYYSSKDDFNYDEEYGFRFSELKELDTVYLPDTAVEIGRRVFEGCKKLEHVRFSPYTTCLYSGAFDGCVSLKKLEELKRLRHIGNVCFRDCTGLREVTLGKSLEKIEMDAFANCSNLERVIFKSDGIEEIGSRAFSNCTKLSELQLPRHEISKPMGSAIFYNCSSLKTVILPEHIRKMPTNIFNDCTSLENLVFTGSEVYINREIGPFFVPDNIFLPKGMSEEAISYFLDENKTPNVYTMDSIDKTIPIEAFVEGQIKKLKDKKKTEGKPTKKSSTKKKADQITDLDQHTDDDRDL